MNTLHAGQTFEFTYTVPENKTVPHLFPESAEFQQMPHVLATGFMVGLVEWACIDFVNRHINWPTEQTVGIDVKLDHRAATPPGFTVTVKGELKQVDGKRLVFAVSAHDGKDTITEGTHERFIIDAAKFNERLQKKRSDASG